MDRMDEQKEDNRLFVVLVYNVETQKKNVRLKKKALASHQFFSLLLIFLSL